MDDREAVAWAYNAIRRAGGLDYPAFGRSRRLSTPPSRHLRPRSGDVRLAADHGRRDLHSGSDLGWCRLRNEGPALVEASAGLLRTFGTAEP